MNDDKQANAAAKMAAAAALHAVATTAGSEGQWTSADTAKRRRLMAAACGGAALLAARGLGAQVVQPGPILDERDPQAVALGYVKDAAKLDKRRFPKFQAGQHCAACQLYRGAPTLAQAPCTVFGGKVVMGAGWCTAFVQR